MFNVWIGTRNAIQVIRHMKRVWHNSKCVYYDLIFFGGIIYKRGVVNKFNIFRWYFLVYKAMVLYLNYIKFKTAVNWSRGVLF